MSQSESEFLSRLLNLANLFDLGIEIVVADNGISISGRDYLPGNPKMQEYAYVDRSYDVPVEISDDPQANSDYVDTLTAVIAQIKADGEKISQLEPSA